MHPHAHGRKLEVIHSFSFSHTLSSSSLLHSHCSYLVLGPEDHNSFLTKPGLLFHCPPPTLRAPDRATSPESLSEEFTPLVTSLQWFPCNFQTPPLAPPSSLQLHSSSSGSSLFSTASVPILAPSVPPSMLNFSPLEVLLKCHALLLPLSLCTHCSFSLEHLSPRHCPFSKTWETHLPIWKGPPFCFHSTRCIFITLYPNCSFVCLPLLAIRSLKMWTMSDSLIHLYAENKTVHREGTLEMPHE